MWGDCVVDCAFSNAHSCSTHSILPPPQLTANGLAIAAIAGSISVVDELGSSVSIGSGWVRSLVSFFDFFFLVEVAISVSLMIQKGEREREEGSGGKYERCEEGWQSDVDIGWYDDVWMYVVECDR